MANGFEFKKIKTTTSTTEATCLINIRTGAMPIFNINTYMYVVMKLLCYDGSWLQIHNSYMNPFHERMRQFFGNCIIQSSQATISLEGNRRIPFKRNDDKQERIKGKKKIVRQKPKTENYNFIFFLSVTFNSFVFSLNFMFVMKI